MTLKSRLEGFCECSLSLHLVNVTVHKTSDSTENDRHFVDTDHTQ